MIPGHHRSAADRPTVPPPVPRQPRCLACAIAISVALWAVLILAGIHLYARIAA